MPYVHKKNQKLTAIKTSQKVDHKTAQHIYFELHGFQTKNTYAKTLTNGIIQRTTNTLLPYIHTKIQPNHNTKIRTTHPHQQHKTLHLRQQQLDQPKQPYYSTNHTNTITTTATTN